MRWLILGCVVFMLIIGLISSAVERRRDEKYIEEMSRQLGKDAEWWYGKNKKD